jgi:CheY-like chemotaxis protein
MTILRQGKKEMSKEVILVVEDDAAMASVVELHLQREGYEVVRAATIPEGLLIVRAQPPDLVILDLTVLDVDPFGGIFDGFAFLSLLEQPKALNSFPVIIHSADVTPAVEKRAKEKGVFAVIKKGEDPQKLLRAVHHALHRDDNREAA